MSCYAKPKSAKAAESGISKRRGSHRLPRLFFGDDMEHALFTVMTSCLGVPYIWGGNNPMTGMDCSGFAIWCLRSIGLWKGGDDTAQGLYVHYKTAGHVLTMDDELPLGTLLFFGTSLDTITHITMAIDDDLMIEAGGGGSKTKTPADAAKAGACVRIRPISTRKDLVALVCPYRLRRPLG